MPRSLRPNLDFVSWLLKNRHFRLGEALALLLAWLRLQRWGVRPCGYACLVLAVKHHCSHVRNRRSQRVRLEVWLLLVVVGTLFGRYQVQILDAWCGVGEV